MKSNRAGKFIRRRRHELGLTAREVAGRSGITPAYLSILESGRNPKTLQPSRPGYAVIQRLSEILDISLERLLVLFGYDQGTHRFHPSGKDSGSLDKFIPSGVHGCKLREQDHVLLLSEGRPDREFRISLDFALAGSRSTGGAVVRLPPDRSIRNARMVVADRRRQASLENIMLVPWDEGVTPVYQARVFTRPETVRAHTADLSRLPAKVSSVRFATPDASSYFSWVRNPRDVLRYEHIWMDDLRRITGPLPVTSLCLYRKDDLEKQENVSLSVATMMLDLLQSHTSVWYLRKDGRCISGIPAVREIITNLPMAHATAREWRSVRDVGNKFQIWGS